MSRADMWRVDLLDAQENVKLTLPRVREGKLDWSIFRAVSGGGSLSWTQDDVPISWLTDRIRITHIDGAGVETPLGVWLPSMPGWDTSPTATTTTVELLDKTELLNSPVGSWVTYPAGTVVTDQVAAIIAARGERHTLITASTATLSTAQSWEPGDTWLTVVNDLLASINYASLWADMDGLLVVAPYVAPGDRLVVATYGGDPGDALMTPEWSDRAEIFALPTGARIYVAGDESTPGLIGAADLPEAHPLSAVSRGREILIADEGEADSQATANALAQRALDDAMRVTRNVEVAHPLDGTQVNDAVHHRPLGLDATITQRSIDMGVGAVVTDTIRHIYTGGELPWPVT